MSLPASPMVLSFWKWSAPGWAQTVDTNRIKILAQKHIWCGMKWKTIRKWATSWQNQVNVRPVWSESSLSAWRKLGPLATHWAHSEDSGQTGRMPRLIWVFAGRTVTLLVLSRGGSNENGKQVLNEHCRGKTCLRGLRPGKTQTGPLNYRH